MTDWKASAEYAKIADVNRKFYARTAGLYDTTETCVNDARIQAGLESDLDRIVALLGGPNQRIQALDACGGSGNVSLKLLKRGVEVTQTDISPELQAIFGRKCQEAGYVPRIICSEIGRFLAEESRAFQLITFSSALHHLEDIETVLKLAFERLAPGGLLYSNFDPTLRKQMGILTRAAMRLDYYIFKVLFQTADFPKAIGRRVRRMLSQTTPDRKLSAALGDDTLGLLAEYHVDSGIDDRDLVARMRRVGYEVVWHERYAEARFQILRRFVAWKGDATTFKLLLRKPRRP